MNIHEGKSLRAFLKYYAIPVNEFAVASGFVRSTVYLDFEKIAIDGDHKTPYIAIIKKKYLGSISNRESREVDESEITDNFVFRFSIDSLRENKAFIDCKQKAKALESELAELKKSVVQKDEQIAKLINLLATK